MAHDHPSVDAVDAGGEAICSSCGRRLPKDAPRRLCPSCLVRDCLDLDAGEEKGASSGLGDLFGSPGVELEGYELIDELGGGASGTVYRARQKALGRLV